MLEGYAREDLRDSSEISAAANSKWSKLRATVCAAGALAAVTEHIPTEHTAAMQQAVAQATSIHWTELCTEVDDLHTPLTRPAQPSGPVLNAGVCSSHACSEPMPAASSAELSSWQSGGGNSYRLNADRQNAVMAAGSATVVYSGAIHAAEHTVVVLLLVMTTFWVLCRHSSSQRH